MESAAMEGSSECFVCQYQASTDGAFAKLPEGYPFKFLWKFLKLPLQVERLNLSAISNSEFCVACEQIILEAMEVCEKMKALETQASSLRSYLRNNFSSSNSAMSSGTSVSASKSLRKFLVQCLNECKVVIPRLPEDQLARYHLPVGAYTGDKVVSATIVEDDDVTRTELNSFSDLPASDGGILTGRATNARASHAKQSGSPRKDETARPDGSCFVKFRSYAQVSRRRLGRPQNSLGRVAPAVAMEPIVVLHESDSEDGPNIADSALADSDFVDSDPGESDSDASDSDDDFVPSSTAIAHPLKRIARPRKEGEPPKRPKSYQCRHCERKFDVKNDLRAHLRLAHNDVILSTCSYCGLDFKEKCQTPGSEQGEESDKTFICGLNGCKRTYKSITELRRHHQRKCAENPKVKSRIGNVFTCEKCGKSYSSQHGLEFHKASKHEQKFKLCCEICGMGFQQPSQLKTHMISHTNEKQFECEICKMRFRRKHQLTYHTRLHTGERPYVCELCGKGFIVHQKLKIHTESVHGSNKYPCELCGKTFASQHYLYNHVTVTHYGRRRQRKNTSKLPNADENPVNLKAPKTVPQVSSLLQEEASVGVQGNSSRMGAPTNEGNVIAEIPRPPDPRFLINPPPVLPEIFRYRDHLHALSSVTHPADNPQPSYSFHKFC